MKTKVARKGDYDDNINYTSRRYGPSSQWFVQQAKNGLLTSCRDDNAITALVYKSLEFSYLFVLCMLEGFFFYICLKAIWQSRQKLWGRYWCLVDLIKDARAWGFFFFFYLYILLVVIRNWPAPRVLDNIVG